MSSINRNPFGILGFLGIKNFGRNPSSVADVLAPTWDYSDWYLNTNSTLLTANPTLTAVGGTIIFQVPDDRVWWVSNFDVFVSTDPGEAIRYNIARFTNATLTQRCVLGPQETVGASTDLRTGYFGSPIILSPGEGLGVNIMSITGNITAFSNVRVTEMPT
jgi:hypothetical protein